MSEPGSAPAAPPAAPRTRNWPAWLAPLVALFGLLSYFLLFARWPILRDLPWLNLLILAGAVVLGGMGLRRARSTLGRVASGLGLAFSLALLTLLCWYAFYWSYQLPDPRLVVGEGTEIPAITLTSWNGEAVDLAEVASGAKGDLILVFYRGYW